MLIKRTERQTRRSDLAARSAIKPIGGLDRRSFLRRSGLVAGGLAAIGALPLASVRKAEAGRAANVGRRHHPQEHLHALLGRLHGDRRGVKRRLDWPGAELGYRRSIAARIAPRALRCANSSPASAGSSIR